MIIPLYISIIGSSQDPCTDSPTDVFAITTTIPVDGSADPVPVCIRCAYIGSLLVRVTNLSQVTYNDDNGVPLVNNTNNVVITDNGLILNDPAGSFPDPGDGVQCQYDDGIESGTYAIDFDIFCKL